MTRDECINGLQQIIDQNKSKILVRVHVGYLIHAIKYMKEQEPKRGRWVRLTGMAPPEYHGHKICSLCECFAPYDPLHMGREMLPKYCPGCGAEMEGEVK